MTRMLTQEVAEMPLLPSLVSLTELRDTLGDERVRVFDATVFLRRAVDGGPYTVQSGRASYARAHLPGAGFADLTQHIAADHERPVRSEEDQADE
jgi:3-mercaptopyruvate sulfurtransferase SseA